MASKIVFLTRSLELGGAERQLVLLARGLHGLGHKVIVVTFYDGGALRSELEAVGVRITSLGKSGRWDILGFAGRLQRIIKQEQPDVLHSYLTVPNVCAAMVKAWLPCGRVVWGVRAADMQLGAYDWLARMTDRLERWLAGRPDTIIFNSEAGRQYCVNRGFPPEKAHVVPNGIDAALYRYDPTARSPVREQLELSDDHVVVGLAARFDPMKDHESFVRAAALVSRRHPEARFVCIGGGSTRIQESTRALAEQLGVAEKFRFIGARLDMPGIYSAIDIGCSSSRFGEGFSNTTAEAMACERPCVVTDVGDSRIIVGETGRVVPPGDPEVLAEALGDLIALGPAERQALGRAARARVVEQFSVERLIDRTVKVLRLQ